MQCQIARSRLQDFLEGMLPSRQAVELRQHLASCRKCQAEYESWQSLWTELTGLAPSAEAPDLMLRILPRLGRHSCLPRGLVALFALASLGTFGGLLSWADGIETKQDLLSALLWTIAGVTCAVSIWLYVEHSHRGICDVNRT